MAFFEKQKNIHIYKIPLVANVEATNNTVETEPKK